MAFLWGTLSYLLPSIFVEVSAIYLLIIFLATIGIERLVVGNKNKLAWFAKGNFDKLSVALMALTAIISGLALIVWALWTDNLGFGKQMLLSVAGLPKLFILAFGVPLFATLNAFSEEVIYRGFFQECFQKIYMNPLLAIIAQASVFASLHYAAGFPNGAIGYAMTFVYGSTLGFIRYRTKGILAPYLTHIAADLVIIYFLCYQFL